MRRNKHILIFVIQNNNKNKENMEKKKAKKCGKNNFKLHL